MGGAGVDWDGWVVAGVGVAELDSHGVGGGLCWWCWARFAWFGLGGLVLVLVS